ncbi:hypothetical protein [Nitratireductor sp. GCM10026969]|uniref:hypothetical protein n=1 Tax=Nitratireductor sp. GCM10026969 TaxID=3252645 RepID=UPI003605FF6C
MKLSVRPGKREGEPKLLFDHLLEMENLVESPEGGVVVTVVAKDIYTAKASQRFSLTFTSEEVDMIARVQKAARGERSNGSAGTGS